MVRFIYLLILTTFTILLSIKLPHNDWLFYVCGIASLFGLSAIIFQIVMAVIYLVKKKRVGANKR